MLPPVGVLRRWQSVQTRAIEKDYHLDQKRQQWVQFSNDLQNLVRWLDEADNIIPPHVSPPTKMKDLEAAIRKHKVSRPSEPV